MEFFRKNEKTIIWIIAIIIVPVFGIGGMLTGMAGRGQNPVIGSVGGDTVTMDDLRGFIARHPGVFGKSPSIEQILPVYMGVQKAKLNGFAVADKEIADFLREDPSFQEEDGSFSASKFRKFLTKLKLTEDQFIEGIREKLLISKSQTLLRQPVPVSRDAILHKYHADEDRYKITYAKIPIEKLPKEEEPGYDEIKAVYDQIEPLVQTGTGLDDPILTEYPIANDIRKEWIIVRYLAIPFAKIEQNMDVSEGAVATYYNENRENYRIEEETEEGETPPEDAAPRYKPLNDILKKTIKKTLIEREARNIADLLAQEIKDRSRTTAHEGLNITLKELARIDYMESIEVNDDFTLKPGQYIVSALSDPVELPANPYSPLIIDRAIGQLYPDFSAMYGGQPKRTDFDRALEALRAPDTGIATPFLESRSAKFMFEPVWWPNKEMQGTDTRPDLGYIVPFPEPADVGIEPETEDGDDREEDNPVATVEEIKSLLDIKIENARLNSGIAVYQKIKKTIIKKREEANARQLAEDLQARLEPDRFDEISNDAGWEVKVEPLQTLPAGGEAVKACFHLTPKTDLSEIFRTRDSQGKEFFCIGMLLEKEAADEAALTDEESLKIKESLARQLEMEYMQLMEMVTDLEIAVE